MWPRALVVCALIGCGGDFPDPSTTPPTPPDTNDPAFKVRQLKDWYLVGDAVTPGQDQMTMFVDAPAGTDFIDAYVAELAPIRLSRQPDGSFAAQFSIADVPAGAHDVLLSANGAHDAFAKVTFRRSAPYYVLVSTDWDFSDPGVTVIDYQDAMHMKHPDLRITHFVGPYTFTDPNVSPARQQTLVDWLIKERDTFHDEIGLHIHPYCNFVTHAGLSCVTDQSTVYPEGDTSGYTIKLGAYGRDNMGVLLQHASDLFEQHGLNRPKTFRAGGWTATLDTLAALADKGFVADTSALNWARIEEWKGKELYSFCMANWAPIGDTSQPYMPSQADMLTSTPPTLSLLEVPDNGVMIDYVTLPEMTGIFDANWNGDALAAPVTLMMGFHPSQSFSPEEFQRVDGFLDYADSHLASRSLGPVVYITLNDIVPVFH